MEAGSNKLTTEDNVIAMLKKIHEQDFTKPNIRSTRAIGETIGEVSYGKQIFLRLKNQKTVKVGNHYEVLLPLK